MAKLFLFISLEVLFSHLESFDVYVVKLSNF